MIIALALTPTAYAEKEDRDKYHYICGGLEIHKEECPYLKRGDIIVQARAAVAMAYCDKSLPILRDGDIEEFGDPIPHYTCKYNGVKAKQFKPASLITK